MLDWEKVKVFLKNQKIDNSKSLMSCLRIAVNMLNSENRLKNIVQQKLSEKYADEIVDIWKPIPTVKQMKTKKKVRNSLPKAFEAIGKNISTLKSVQLKAETFHYKSVKKSFETWDKSIKDSKKNMSGKAITFSNPFLTASIGSSYGDGKTFQLTAKISSSLEGKWGSWIQNILLTTNNNLVLVDAGRFDYVLGSVAYDVKSGPRVYNQGQVDEAGVKKGRIKKLSGMKEFRGLIKVNDFKVAVLYGREELADAMKNSGGLIIFGVESWKVLTGSENNAFKLFLWQIKYKAEQKGCKWTKSQLEEATEHFVRSFYGEDLKKLKACLDNAFYKEIKGMLKT